MPAKAGVGASTIAANTPGRSARWKNINTLLADFDMGVRVTEFMFQTPGTITTWQMPPPTASPGRRNLAQPDQKVGNMTCCCRELHA